MAGGPGGGASEDGPDGSSWLSSSSSSSSSSRSESESESSRSENWCSATASVPSRPSESWNGSSLVPEGQTQESRGHSLSPAAQGHRPRLAAKMVEGMGALCKYSKDDLGSTMFRFSSRTCLCVNSPNPQIILPGSAIPIFMLQTGN